MIEKKQLPGTSEWQTVQLQLIAFADDPRTGLEQEWWRELIGNEGEFHRKKLERSDSGVVDGRALRLVADPLRMVWIAAPLVEVDSSIGFQGPPSMGPFSREKDWFTAQLERWLHEMCPPIRRLAFSAKLMLPTGNRLESYSRLRDYLGEFVAVDENVSDFQYRVNRKRPSQSGIDGLVINRLCTWSSIMFTMQMRMRAGDSAEEREIGHESQGCMLELDINTVKEYSGVLANDRLLPLWNELVGLGSEIVEKGDVP